MVTVKKINTPIINTRSIEASNKILGKLTTIHKTDKYNPQWIRTELKNQFGKTMGFELLTFNKEEKKGTGAVIEVEKEYRQKGFKFGEILRLSSIIEILENQIDEFEIHSKPSAIFFHSKYKFEPAINRFDERDSALLSIIENSKEGFEEIKEEAEGLLEVSYRKKDPETQRQLCKDTNALLKKYIEKIQKTEYYKNFPFKCGMRMILTRNEILKNREFFNSLFINHRINYRI